jgi:hypothetical protein
MWWIRIVRNRLLVDIWQTKWRKDIWRTEWEKQNDTHLHKQSLGYPTAGNMKRTTNACIVLYCQVQYTTDIVLNSWWISKYWHHHEIIFHSTVCTAVGGYCIIQLYHTHYPQIDPTYRTDVRYSTGNVFSAYLQYISTHVSFTYTCSYK